MLPQSPAEPPLSLLERLPADACSVATARRAVRRFAADLQVDLDALALAVSEAVANAVVHAYPDGRSGELDVAAGASSSAVTIVVRDRGRGLGADSEPGAGYGLEIMRRVADHVDVASHPEGVTVTMRFRRGGP